LKVHCSLYLWYGFTNGITSILKIHCSLYFGSGVR